MAVVRRPDDAVAHTKTGIFYAKALITFVLKAHRPYPGKLRAQPSELVLRLGVVAAGRRSTDLLKRQK